MMMHHSRMHSLALFVIIFTQLGVYLTNSGSSNRIMTTLLFCLVSTTTRTTKVIGPAVTTVYHSSPAVPSDVREELIDAIKMAFACFGYDTASEILSASIQQNPWLLRLFGVAASSNTQEAVLAKVRIFVGNLRLYAVQGDWKKFKTSLKSLLK
jgi:hypothetical protein